MTNALSGALTWQGYLLGPIGLGGREGTWAFANLGVLAALTLCFVGYLLLGRRHVRRQEVTGQITRPAVEAPTAT